MTLKKERLLAALSILLTSIAVIGIVVVLVLDTTGVIGKKNTESKVFSIDLVAPPTLEQGSSSKWQVFANNNTKKDINLKVALIADGVNLAPSTEGDTVVETLASESISEAYGSEWAGSDGLTWQPSILKKGKSISLEFIGLPTLVSGQQGKVKAIAYEVKQTGRRCGFLWLTKCDISVAENEIAQSEKAAVVGSLDSQSRNTLTLYKGFNLVSLPVTLNSTLLSRFWGQFTQPLAWHLDATSQSWQNVTQSQYYSSVKPGSGMWLYHPDGGDVLIPDGDPVAIDGNYEVKLSTGWNQIGNPYQYRIKWDGDRILVKRDGQETITLSGAIEEGSIAKVLGVAGAQSGTGDVEPTYIEIVIGRFLPIGSGLFVNTDETMTLVFPGKTIFAPGELISAVEKAKILSWINNNNLNVCGNSQSSSLGGNPLYDSQTGETLDQFDCVLMQHPDRPWNN